MFNTPGLNHLTVFICWMFITLFSSFCLGPWEIWCLILQCTYHCHPHSLGKCIYWRFTQGTHSNCDPVYCLWFLGPKLNAFPVWPPACFNPQAVTFEDWVKATFIVCFLVSCFMGYVTGVQLDLLNYCHTFVETPNTNLCSYITVSA